MTGTNVATTTRTDRLARATGQRLTLCILSTTEARGIRAEAGISPDMITK